MLDSGRSMSYINGDHAYARGEEWELVYRAHAEATEYADRADDVK